MKTEKSVYIQNINVLKPFKIENDENIYMFNDSLVLMDFSFVNKSWEKSYRPIQRIITGSDKIRPVYIWDEKDIALLGNLYLFGYRTIDYTDEVCIGYAVCIAYSEDKMESLVMNDYPQYNNIVKYLSEDENTSWEIAEILTEVGSNIAL